MRHSIAVAGVMALMTCSTFPMERPASGEDATSSAANARSARKERIRIAIRREKLAWAFWSDLHEGKFEDAAKRLTPTLVEELGEPGLKGFLAGATKDYGALSGESYFSGREVADRRLSSGITRWEKAKSLPTFISFDGSDRIDGIWLAPEETDNALTARAVGSLRELSQLAKYSLTARIVGQDNKPIAKASIRIWRAVDPSTLPEADRGGLWRDEPAGRVWRVVERASIGDILTARHLLAGLYRVTAREGHDSSGAVAISDSVELGGEATAREIDVPLIAGSRVTIRPVDIDTKGPAPDAGVSVRLVDPRYPDWQFRPSSQDKTVSVFESLPPGKYEVSGERRAPRPEGMIFEMAEEKPLVVDVAAGADQTVELPLRGRLMTAEEIDRRWGWTAFGQVLDASGKPIEDALVGVNTGWGTLLGGCTAKTNAEGEFRLLFSEGFHRNDPTGANTQAAVFWVRKDGFVLQSSSQPMSNLMSRRPLEGRGQETTWVSDTRKVVVKGKPFRIDFVMAPAARLTVKLVDGDGKPIDSRELDLKGTSELGSSWKREQELAWDLLPGADWWFTYSSKELGVSSVRTLPFRLPAAGDYQITLRALPDRDGGAHVLEIVSLTADDGQSIAKQTIGDDPLARPPVDEALQQRGRQILKDLAERNRLWLTFKPQPVAEYSYLFHLKENEAKRYSIQPDQPVPGVVRHGISYVSALHGLVAGPSNVKFRQVDISDERILLTYTLSKPIPVSAGNGVLGTWRGFFSSSVAQGTLTIDARRMTPLEHRAAGRRQLVETFSQFHEVAPGQFAPLAIEVNGGHIYRWTFQAFDAGLWLFAASYQPGVDGTLTTVAHLDEVKIGDETAKPTAVGKPEW